MITAIEQPKVDILIMEPVPIIDGYVTITVGGSGPGSLTIKCKVKQVKGRGVHDAEHLVDVNENHLETISILMTVFHGQNFKSKQVYEALNHQRKKRFIAGDGKYIEMPRPTHTRTMSELLQKKIIVTVSSALRVDKIDKRAPEYVLDSSKALNIFETRKFDQS